MLDWLLDKFPDNNGIILVGDMNASVGRCDSEELSDVLGPFGLNKRNDKGRDLIETYQSNNLSIMNTFFNSSTFITHESFNEQKTKSMLDMIAASVEVKPKVINCQVVHGGIQSDHSQFAQS